MSAEENNRRGAAPKGPKFNFTWLFVGMMALIAFMFFTKTGDTSDKEVDYSTFKKYVSKGYVDKIKVNKGDLTLVMTIKPACERIVFNNVNRLKGQRNIKVEIGSIEKLEEFMDSSAASGKFDGQISYEQQDDFFVNLLWNVMPLIIILAIWIFAMRRMGTGGVGGGGIFSIGKSKAKLFEKDSANTKRVTFKDVAGQQGAKEEVKEIVDFLKNPQKYTTLGGKIPKGALLVGPPGTGKTLLAKAVAGEADVPFFSMSGSDFVEMFVGVGVSRVRDLFQQAKEKAPCIIFIDEIDAIGRARSKSASIGGGNEDRESTLNQLLTEMDGFGSNTGVIVLAATNRADILDKALLRAGRFDRQIHVDLPDLNERKEIFNVHLRPVKIDESVDVDMLARQTPGFSGADIANVCNEAALIAARNNSEWVTKQHFLDAVDRIVGGLEKKTKLLTQNEKRTIALHEAGHATISWFLQYANPLVKVTIVPRGRALGAAWYMPEERQITTKEEMLDEICATLGGRAAEELCIGRISTGAMNDLETVTKRAYGMIAYAGMGDKLPNLCYYGSNDEYSLSKPYSEHTAELIDEEVMALINMQYERAKRVLLEHKDGHAQLAQILMDREVIFAEDVERIFGKRPWVSRTDEILASDTQDKKSEDHNSTDYKDENAEIIRQKAIDAVLEKIENGQSEAKTDETPAEANPKPASESDTSPAKPEVEASDTSSKPADA